MASCGLCPVFVPLWWSAGGSVTVFAVVVVVVLVLVVVVVGVAIIQTTILGPLRTKV